MVGAQATVANLATPRLVEGIQDRGHKLSILTTAFPNSEARFRGLAIATGSRVITNEGESWLHIFYDWVSFCQEELLHATGTPCTSSEASAQDA